MQRWAVEWAASSGEDYQLLFCAPAAEMERAVADVRALGLRATVIGALEEGRGVRLVDGQGQDVHVGRRGWDHFACGTSA